MRSVLSGPQPYRITRGFQKVPCSNVLLCFLNKMCRAFFVCLFIFVWLHQQHTEVSGPGIESKPPLQPMLLMATVDPLTHCAGNPTHDMPFKILRRDHWLHFRVTSESKAEKQVKELLPSLG